MYVLGPVPSFSGVLVQLAWYFWVGGLLLRRQRARSPPDQPMRSTANSCAWGPPGRLRSQFRCL